MAEIDYMEYSSDANAQAAYVTNSVFPNVLTGGTATASSVTNGAAAQVVDGNITTRWCTDVPGVPAWWKYDLGAAVTKTVRKLRLKNNDGLTKNWILAGSNNDSTYTDITSGLETSDINQDWVTYTFTNATAYRYYRLSFADSYSNYVSLYEIEMMEGVVALQSYSESTIKTQGSYALKAVASGGEVVDQQATDTGNDVHLGNNGGDIRWVCQVFQLQSASYISALEAHRFASTSGTPTGNWEYRIETDNAGVPSGTLVNANATVSVTPPAQGASAKGTFSTPVLLAANTTYHFVIKCDAQSTNVWWKLTLSSSNVYAYGNFGYYSSSAWTIHGSLDCWFKVYGYPSLNKTLTRTLASNIDLSGVNTLKLDMRATRTGANVKVGLHDTGGTTTELTPTINTAGEYETKSLDISAVADADKNAIDSLIFTWVNADAANTVYFDNFVTSFPATVNATKFTLTATGHFPIDIIIIEETLVLILHDPTVTLSSSVTTTVQELTAALKDPAYHFDYVTTVTAQELTATLNTHAPVVVTRIIRRAYTFGATEQVTYTKLNNFMDTAIWEISNQEAGDMFYYNGSVWFRIPKGTAGQKLTLVAGVPTWA